MRIGHRQIYEGERIPAWYGVSYVDHVRAETVCHLVPINLLVRAWRWPQMLFDVKLKETREAGFQAGYEEGYGKGRLITREEMRREAQRQVYEMIRRAKHNQPWWIDAEEALRSADRKAGRQ